MKNWNKSFGVYALFVKDQQIFTVIRQNGAFQHKYDLPGGFLMEEEMLHDALKKAFTGV